MGPARPLVFIVGINVLEPEPDLGLQVAQAAADLRDDLGIPWIFKASWDKANRTSHRSYRGPGLREGLRQLLEIRRRFDVPVLTDVHEPWQAEPVAEVVDMLQVPAFLVRQTDLLAACSATGRPLHLKRMTSLDPSQLGFAVEKCRAFGAKQVVLCERGTSFGPGPLVVDPLGLVALQAHGVPVSLDVTHALQAPGGARSQTEGRGHLTEPLARAGVAQGLSAVFLEVHPEPTRARCDGPSATRLEALPVLVRRLQALDALVKGWGP
ncbi:MAG: 3-deoxy-8-phosphooctulonate synthase [Deltaproteobacteria bacterium]|nr:MAG: 3-deoxy-8-phosphooctulonate synthase [Deltaproteobacteria bacterium]